MNSLSADRRRGLLWLGDTLCFLVFAALGLRNHDDGITATELLRVAGPFIAAWSLTVLVMPTPAMAITPGRLAASLLRAWLPALVIAIGLRSLVEGETPCLSGWPVSQPRSCPSAGVCFTGVWCLEKTLDRL